MPLFFKRINKHIDPGSEYEARLGSVDDSSPHSFSCTHPGGAARCTALVACSACPFAELLELDVAA